MIEEWRATIVVAARDPKDFAHIRDMHRLLRMKGYTFPQITLDAQAVLGPSDVPQQPSSLNLLIVLCGG
jgi:ADP-ribosylation factor-binding protein GGA